MPKIQFDPRSNTKNGKPRQEPYEKENGARLVAKAKKNEYDPGAGQFRIGENQAKKINHDAMPK
ncbi:MAG TPA: hypothetical protein VH724_15405 [Candidatus Angelobacter sp.]|jgi:hypothetical protein|nr:hypothetical protein [Candidatus Angelobacter sp.]